MTWLPAASLDCLTVGYSAGWVLRGGVGGGLGEFGPAAWPSVGRGGSISPGRAPLLDQAGGSSELPASNTVNQALSAAQLGAVAPLAVAPPEEGEAFQGDRSASRLIASVPTQRRGAAAQADRQGLEAGGGRPPSRPRACPYTLSLSPELETGGSRTKAAPGVGSTLACDQRRSRPGRNVSFRAMGSGVRGARERGFSGAETRSAERRVARNRVRVSVGHGAFDLARTGKLESAAARCQ